MQPAAAAAAACFQNPPRALRHSKSNSERFHPSFLHAPPTATCAFPFPPGAKVNNLHPPPPPPRLQFARTPEANRHPSTVQAPSGATALTATRGRLIRR